MSRKIVAIGGGECGRIKIDGTRIPYETREIDLEIIALTGKKHPNFLFIGYAQNNPNYEDGYFATMKAVYGDLFGCECKCLKKAELKTNIIKAQELVDWADIIYEGGGDTKGMMELWTQTGFDKILYNAWMNGKIMCGVSAGANCWFQSCSSDSLKIQLKDDTAPMITVECLGFIPAFFTPHCDEANENVNRLQHMKESLRNTELIGLGMSNCCAIEIVDGQYRLITTDASRYGIAAYGIKTYWNNNEYVEKYIDSSEEYKPLEELLSKSN